MTACVNSICKNIDINISKGNKMIDKIIDVLGYMLIGFLVIYAVCFYATELIRIIS